MKNQYFKILLLGCLLLAFGTVSFAQNKKPRKQKVYKMIISNDFDKPAPSNTVRKKKQVKKGKKWRKRCRYESFRRKGRITRVYRCRNVRY